MKKINSEEMLTAEGLSIRWRGEVQANTLANWRAAKMGPPYIKLGKGRNARVVYRLKDIEAYEKENRKK